MERGLTKQQIIATMTLSPHGDLSAYLPICGEAARTDPEFMARFTSYLAENSQVRDINVALPIICLAEPKFKDEEHIENALAHLAKLSPRELVQAYQFGKHGLIRNKDEVEEKVQALQKDGTPVPGKFRVVKKKVGGWKVHPIVVGYPALLLQRAGRVNTIDRLIVRYLRSRESNHSWFERNVVQFRSDLERLYFLSHTKPSEHAKAVLYDKVKPCGSSIEAISELSRMNPKEAAAAIIEFRLPFLTINSVLGEKAKDPAILMAMIDRMSPSELQTNAKMLEKFGMKDHPETRAAFEAGLARMTTAKGSAKTTLKTSKAAAAVTDEGTRQKLQATQEKQLATVRGIEGNWAVLGDRSPSMRKAMEAAKAVAGILAKMVRGKVYLVFFDSSPTYFDVSGKTYEEIQAITRHIDIGSATSIGCGLQYILDRKLTVDGIAVVSDAAENTAPGFADRYKRYVDQMGNEPTVYLYRFANGMPARSDIDLAVSMQRAGLDLQEFDLRRGFDLYSLPNLVRTMSTGRYGLLDEIMGAKLITVDSVLKGSVKGALVTV